MDIYIDLFLCFFKIGLFAFGGGYAVISLIQHDIVEVNGWLSAKEFTDIVAISQTTPGPIGVNAATYVGYTATGSAIGAFVATFAMLLPSIILMLIICYFFGKFHQNKYIEYCFLGLRPAIIGLIAAVCLQLTNKENFIDYKSAVIFLVVLLASKKVHPIWLILGSGLAGWLLYSF
ncbi:MAG: chromate transporter [Bacteroidales bacterium]|nr:chromate transporter [Bacteroidales bacterium]